MRFIGLLIFLSWVVASNSAFAASFTATQVCDANKKLTSDNPGQVQTQVGKTYSLINKNKEPPTHLQIKVPGAPVTDLRWVPIDCGTVSDQAPVKPTARTEQPALENSIENILAASWQTTFCATNAGKSKVECQKQRVGMPHTTQFSIHGLWPDDLDDRQQFPCYCNSGEPKSCRTKQKRESRVQIEKATWEQLQTLMPGVQSGLHLHEWTKHGSCYENFLSGEGKGSDPTEYFADTLLLVQQLNDSKVADLFRSRLGQTIELAELKRVFNEQFGHGAGERVFMNCSRIDGDAYISELWIGLGGEINADSQLGELMLAAPPTTKSMNRRPCQQGKVYELK